MTDKGKRLTATITDPIFTRRLELGYSPQQPCLVTVSLSMPWRPSDWEGSDPWWKSIAAVIELPEQDIKAHTVREKSDWTDADLDDLPF